MSEDTNELNYQLIDSGHLEKFESINGYKIIRPSAVALWSPQLKSEDWKKASSRFKRDSKGGGQWTEVGQVSESQWQIDVLGYKMELKKTSFGHLGIFPEQWENWRQLHHIVSKYKSFGLPCKVLNLFAYTGGATLACASGGAEVTHLDASKVSVNWAKKNASLSSLEETPIRWIVDDVVKFVNKELKRGVVYDGVILDPPTFGRGPKNQMWKIEKDLRGLLQTIVRLLNPKQSFVLLSSHSQGHSPLALKNMLCDMEYSKKASYYCSEMTVEEANGSGRLLPSGSSCFMLADSIKDFWCG